MPAFESLVPSKRKIDDTSLSSSRKRSSDSNHDRVAEEEIWMVQWRNPQAKKHKTWDGDAVLVGDTGSNKATLYDSDGKVIASGRLDLPFFEGKNLSVGSKEIELDCLVPKSEYLSGACFGQASAMNTTSQSARNGCSLTPNKRFVQPIIGKSSRPIPAEDQLCGMLLQPTNLPSNVERGKEAPTGLKIEESHWTANWRKQQTRKHKTWDGDAYISQIGNRLQMITEDGKLMGSTAWKGEFLQPGFRTFINGKEVELDIKVSASQLPTLRTCLAPADDRTVIGHVEMPIDSAGFHVLPPTNSFISPASFYSAVVKPQVKGPLHNPEGPDALVMKSPNKMHIQRFNKKCGSLVVPVVLDPILTRRMRPHQKEGVKFMYECVMGLRKHEGNGCILADEMGLGKTLQTIALIWTLLKQSPYIGMGPIAKKVLIVCPVTLISNWKAEFQKWLGKDRVGVTVCDKDKVNIDVFFYNKNHHVLIIGYERLRTVIDKIATAVPSIDLLICDEGHRLKSANNKTTTMFQALKTRRRIILSGTPIQNDLSEFHAMAEFCNPGLLDEYSTFRRVYEVPILKSRAPEASAKEIESGEARTAQLLTVANSFVLRRDASLLKKHLPPKYEYVVFVTPTPLQLSLFSTILRPERLDDLTQGSTAESLALINILTKISNSPILLKATADNAKSKSGDVISCIQRTGVKDALKLLPDVDLGNMSLSGKLITLKKMLDDIQLNTDEKCVLVSHYTSTLNILESFCRKKNYSYYRLDGQTPQAKRQEFVNSFNKSSQRSSFIFLLSSKAGGVGINLIGASRLFLIDSDWNPSHDLQSMARCHRDGQKRPVFIYRLLTAGAIDEKIYQRQVTKLGLSASLIGSDTTSSKSDSFSRKDLRDIFRINLGTGCNTHDLLDCLCDNVGFARVQGVDFPQREKEFDSSATNSKGGFITASHVSVHDAYELDSKYMEKKKADLASLSEWKHINCLKLSASDEVLDDVLRAVLHDCGPKPKSFLPLDGDSRIDTLLKAVDIDNINATDQVISVNDVPGGTVSFLFEKSTQDCTEGSAESTC